MDRVVEVSLVGENVVIVIFLDENIEEKVYKIKGSVYFIVIGLQIFSMYLFEICFMIQFFNEKV